MFALFRMSTVTDSDMLLQTASKLRLERKKMRDLNGDDGELSLSREQRAQRASTRVS